ncbi:hypothetical protein HispidOSU_010359, partial [Sigmodon hispidus]
DLSKHNKTTLLKHQPLYNMRQEITEGVLMGMQGSRTQQGKVSFHEPVLGSLALSSLSRYK